MEDAFQPGDLVVRRVRWHASSTELGLVVSTDINFVLVLWSIDDHVLGFKQHSPLSLTAVTDSNEKELKQRCCLAT